MSSWPVKRMMHACCNVKAASRGELFWVSLSTDTPLKNVLEKVGTKGIVYNAYVRA